MNNVVVVVAQILSSYNSDAHLNWLGTMHVFPFNSDCLNLQKSAFGYILILVYLEIPREWKGCDLQPAAHEALQQSRPQYSYICGRYHDKTISQGLLCSFVI